MISENKNIMINCLRGCTVEIRNMAATIGDSDSDHDHINYYKFLAFVPMIGPGFFIIIFLLVAPREKT